MDKELIERLAVEAGMYIEGPTSGQEGLLRADVGDLMRFAALVAEECAKVVDKIPRNTNVVDLDAASKATRAKFKP